MGEYGRRAPARDTQEGWYVTVMIVAAELDWAVSVRAFMAAAAALKTTDRGTMPCPKCGAVLTFWVVGRKRYSRGLCATLGCIAWLE